MRASLGILSLSDAFADRLYEVERCTFCTDSFFQMFLKAEVVTKIPNRFGVDPRIRLDFKHPVASNRGCFCWEVGYASCSRGSFYHRVVPPKERCSQLHPYIHGSAFFIPSIPKSIQKNIFQNFEKTCKDFRPRSTNGWKTLILILFGEQS